MLAWLRSQYELQDGGQALQALAIGDGLNDYAMLEAADCALLIRSPAHEFPPLKRDSGVIYSKDFGPAGWAEGVARWLHSGTG